MGDSCKQIRLDYNERFEAVDKHIDEINTTLQNNTSRVDSLTTSVNNLSGDVTNLSNEVNDVKTTLAAISTTLNNLVAQMTNNVNNGNNGRNTPSTPQRQNNLPGNVPSSPRTPRNRNIIINNGQQGAQQPEPEKEPPYIEFESKYDFPSCGDISSTAEPTSEVATKWYEEIQLELIILKQKYNYLTKDKRDAKLCRVVNLLKCFNPIYVRSMMKEILRIDANSANLLAGDNTQINYQHILEYVRTTLMVSVNQAKFVDPKQLIRDFAEKYGTLKIPATASYGVAINTYLDEFLMFTQTQLGLKSEDAVYTWFEKNQHESKIFVPEFGALIEEPPNLKYLYHSLHTSSVSSTGELLGPPNNFKWSAIDVKQLFTNWKNDCISHENVIKSGNPALLQNTVPVLSRVGMEHSKAASSPSTPIIKTPISTPLPSALKPATSSRSSYAKPSGLKQLEIPPVSNLETAKIAQLESEMSLLKTQLADRDITSEIMKFQKAQQASHGYAARSNDSYHGGNYYGGSPYNREGARYSGESKYGHGSNNNTPGFNKYSPKVHFQLPGNNYSRPHTPGKRIFTPRGSRSFTPRGYRQFTPRGRRTFTPRGGKYTPRGTPIDRSNDPYTPRGSSFTPRGSRLTPRGSRYTPRGNRYTPRGSIHTPRGSRITPKGTRYRANYDNYNSGRYGDYHTGYNSHNTSAGGHRNDYRSH
jgi:hypothetical protein